jgi:hypothetical protein
MNYIYAQVGFLKTWFLVLSTVAMVLAAHALAFRDAFSAQSLDWRHRPFKSLFSVGVKHQISYGKKVPYMLGALVVMVLAVCYL